MARINTAQVQPLNQKIMTKEISNKSTKHVDTRNVELNSPTSGSSELSPDPAPKTIESQLSPPQPESESDKYTISPDGKYKFIKTEYDSQLLEETSLNLPTIKKAGYVIAWPHDIKANSIPSMIAKGWEFVDSYTLQKHGIDRKIPAGRTQTGETAFHYAMEMPEGKYKEMKQRENDERDMREQSMKLNPSSASKNIYGTEQMNFSRAVIAPRMS